MSWRVNIDKDLYKDNSKSPFITYGENGILYLRMQSPDDDSLWDAHLDNTGAWVTESVPSGGAVGSPIGLLLALTYAT